jgi:hypothetical protein
MRGKIIVKKPVVDLASLQGAGNNTGITWLVPLAVGAFLVSLISLYRAKTRPEPPVA